jgi:adiponectin receptor
LLVGKRNLPSIRLPFPEIFLRIDADGLCRDFNANCRIILPTLFQSVEYRPFRAALFFTMGVSGIIPCLHKLLLYQDEPVAYQTLYMEISMGIMYGLGALIYATRIPERWKPGTFDIIGNSHQLFHILVVAGAYTHYQGGLLYLKWRDVTGCPTS